MLLIKSINAIANHYHSRYYYFARKVTRLIIKLASPSLITEQMFSC